MHGRISHIHHNGQGLFQGIPSPFNATRYHSLVAEMISVPSCLSVTAVCDSQTIIMGLDHFTKPIWSVQFHPESICTEYGQTIVNNFIQLASSFNPNTGTIQSVPLNSNPMTVIPSSLSDPPFQRSMVVVSEKLDGYLSSQTVFDGIFQNVHPAFWIDSAKVENNMARYSYMGDTSGPLSFLVKYSLMDRMILKTTLKGTNEIPINPNETFFHWLSREHVASLACEYQPSQPEFPFCGGFVGYLGYEMKAESMHSNIKTSYTHDHFLTLDSNTPSSSFLFADRVIVFDHLENQMYLVTLEPRDGTLASQQSSWRSLIMDQLKNLTDIPFSIDSCKTQALKPSMTLLHSEPEYKANVQAALEKIKQGETYEACLTTQLTKLLLKGHPDPLTFYKHLRSRNPAPYSAYLSFGNGFVVTSSSPERFLQINRDGWISMKPIKGTIKRCQLEDVESREERDIEDQKRIQWLQSNEKDRSENLMIVDLVRNDLNQVSEPNSVHVPQLMKVETFATVHQLVTTVKGKLRNDLNAVDAVMRSFPPGSMTGAPKLRTIQILETLEKAPRGVYSGCLGYFSVSGCADFNVVIRTAVFSPTENGTLVSIGAGGAVVALSDPQQEFDEMLLKSNSVVPSIDAIYSVI